MQRYRLLATVLLFVAPVSLAACSGAEQSNEVVSEVQEKGDRVELEKIAGFYLDGELVRALSELESYLDRYPQDDLAWTIMGNLLEDKNLDNEAELAYQEALRLNPDNFQATNALGVIHRKKGDYDKAMEFYQKALVLQPGYAQAYSSIAIIELKRENDERALEFAKKGYANDPEDPVIAANLAVVYHYNNMFEERDKFTRIAEELGYQNIDSLAQIYNGSVTVRD